MGDKIIEVERLEDIEKAVKDILQDKGWGYIVPVDINRNAVTTCVDNLDELCSMDIIEGNIKIYPLLSKRTFNQGNFERREENKVHYGFEKEDTVWGFVTYFDDNKYSVLGMSINRNDFQDGSLQLTFEMFIDEENRLPKSYTELAPYYTDQFSVYSCDVYVKDFETLECAIEFIRGHASK